MNEQDPAIRRLAMRLARAAALTAVIWATGCLVVTVNPAYDEHAIAWEPALLGKWHNADDNATLEIGPGEWRSYKVHYEHPTETGDLTGYLTAIGDQRFLDLMPARGEDRGSFLIPVHSILRVRLQGDTLELTPLSHDWFFDRIRAARGVPGLTIALDQKENALVTSSTAQIRAWLRAQPPDGPMFGAPATFGRK